MSLDLPTRICLGYVINSALELGEHFERCSECSVRPASGHQASGRKTARASRVGGTALDVHKLSHLLLDEHAVLETLLSRLAALSCPAAD